MVTRMQKWGNSQGLRVPKELLEKVSITVGQDVEVNVRNGALVVRAACRVRGKYRLRDLLARLPASHSPHEEDWGKPVGKEVW